MFLLKSPKKHGQNAQDRKKFQAVPRMTTTCLFRYSKAGTEQLGCNEGDDVAETLVLLQE
jgi:hypothetical protein